jgi:CubicO group peptidase (beta-lactamase class C family)
MNTAAHMVRGISLLTLLFLIASSPALAQSVTPEDAGLSSERLTRVDNAIEQAIEEGQVAGAVALINRHGSTVYNKTFGMMDREADTPMRSDALFRIASMSKGITSTAIMILYEEGHFLLNDPVSKYIPAFKNPKVIMPAETNNRYTLVPANREITIRMLLNHTSGITYGAGVHREIYDDAGMTVGLTPTEGTIEEMILKLAKLPLISQPGEEFHYGMSIDVLGYLVEVVSGQTFDEFMRERIFEPLGMNDTHFVLPREKLPRLARYYRTDGKGTFTLDAVDLSYLCTQTYFSGGAGLVSSASDYMQFALMILNNGKLNGTRILSRKTVELMTTNSIGDLYAPFRTSSGDKFGYGFGIRTERGEYDELESLGIIGWGGAFYTIYWIDPAEDLVAVLMTQAGGPGLNLRGKYLVSVYQAIDD